MNQLLDQSAKIKTLDRQNALGSVASFPDQLEQIWSETRHLALPESLKNKTRIVVAGMGGSALGGRVAKSLLSQSCSASLEIVTEYHLPSFVDAQTLVVIATYSGNTEESLSCLKDAQRKKAPIVCLTTGGEAGKLIQSKQVSGCIFTPRFNPLGFPKTALGYSVGGLLGLLANLGYFSCSDQNFHQAVNEFKKVQEKNLPANHTHQNPAKQLAADARGKIVTFVASEHLQGAAYTARNQLNEIWHSGSLFFDLPEMNHHLVEAFGKPKAFKNSLFYLLLTSGLYHPRNQKRYEITARVLKKMGIDIHEYSLETSSLLAQVFEVINLGGFLSVYGSLLDGEDPGPEPWIIYFKKMLGAPTH